MLDPQAKKLQVQISYTHDGPRACRWNCALPSVNGICQGMNLESSTEQHSFPKVLGNLILYFQGVCCLPEFLGEILDKLY